MSYGINAVWFIFDGMDKYVKTRKLHNAMGAAWCNVSVQCAFEQLISLVAVFRPAGLQMPATNIRWRWSRWLWFDQFYTRVFLWCVCLQGQDTGTNHLAFQPSSLFSFPPFNVCQTQSLCVCISQLSWNYSTLHGCRESSHHTLCYWSCIYDVHYCLYQG